MDRDRFEELVRRGLESVPPEIARRMDNVDIVVEDEPTPAQLASTGTPRSHTLLGLYVGVPLTRRSSGYNFVAPDRIVIFQRPLERISASEAELVDRVRATVVHEIAHHFGISDARLHEIETERQQRSQ